MIGYVTAFSLLKGPFSVLLPIFGVSSQGVCMGLLFGITD